MISQSFSRVFIPGTTPAGLVLIVVLTHGAWLENTWKHRIKHILTDPQIRRCYVWLFDIMDVLQHRCFVMYRFIYIMVCNLWPFDTFFYWNFIAVKNSGSVNFLFSMVSSFILENKHLLCLMYYFCKNWLCNQVITENIQKLHIAPLGGANHHRREQTQTTTEQVGWGPTCPVIQCSIS